MTNEEAIARIREHKIIHKMNEPRAIYISEALDLAIKALEQQPKTGHWIEKDGFDGDTYYDCSECGESFCLIDGTPTDNLYNYCPNCGAKMVELQESEGEDDRD